MALDFLLEQGMQLMGKEGWQSFSLDRLASFAGLSKSEIYRHFSSKEDFFEAFSQKIDERVFEKLGKKLPEALKDYLFEVLMTRFEVLEPYKKALRSMKESLWHDPLRGVKFLPSFRAFLRRLIEKSPLEKQGICQEAALLGLGIIYMHGFQVWLEDDTPDLSRTMATLDQDLEYFEKAAQFSLNLF